MKYEKIDPRLLAALEDYREEGRQGLSRHIRLLGLVSTEGSPKPPRTVVFIHCHEQANLERLISYDIRVNQRRGRVRTGFLPLESLEPLSNDPAVDRIVPSRYLRMLMDIAPDRVDVPAFRRLNGLDGRGVIIGIVDSGIDPNHAAFQGRILRIWDQTLPGPGVPEGGYGAELTGSLLSVSRDTHGHGTHVAGIAAGEDAIFGGVAPGAEFLIVKSDLQDAHIADGIRYIFRLASDLGRPAVVNLSLGGQGDAHDGSDSLSQIVDSESGSGRIVCCAAGNEGNDNIHAQIAVLAGETRTIRFRVPVGTIGTASLNGWYPGATPFEVSVRTPGGFVTPFQGVISTGSFVRNFSFADSQLRVATPGPDPANGDHNFFVQIHGVVAGSMVKGGVWRLQIRNTSATGARLDVWSVDDQSSPEVVFSGTSVRDSVKIGAPGAAASAVTVASYTTKVQWTDLSHNTQRVGLVLDDISDFSSEGPLRNGSKKPDVAAPGAMIAAALSADSSVLPAYVVAPGYRINAGTSMATPFIAGIVALLLQQDPTLDAGGIKRLLLNSSAIPNQPPMTFDTKWGWGLIDADRL